MVKSKVPFKTNVDQSIRKASANPPKRTAGPNPITKGGIWIRSGRRKRIRASVVNPKKERAHLVMWLLKWVVTVPVAAYLMVWLLILIADLFSV